VSLAHLPHGRAARCAALAAFCVCLALSIFLPAQARGETPPPVDPLAAIEELRARLAASREPEARERLRDLDRLLATASSLRRHDGKPVAVRFRYRPLSDGIEAEVNAVSFETLEISLNETCRLRAPHVIVSYLHELVHIAQFAEGRLGYAPPQGRRPGRWRAVGNDAINEAEAYAESFWIAGTTVRECPEYLWGFLAAYREGWENLVSFVRQERPTLAGYDVLPGHGDELMVAAPAIDLRLQWFSRTDAARNQPPRRPGATPTVQGRSRH